jgi:hypothetical protein
LYCFFFLFFLYKNKEEKVKSEEPCLRHASPPFFTPIFHLKLHHFRRFSGENAPIFPFFMQLAPIFNCTLFTFSLLSGKESKKVRPHKPCYSQAPYIISPPIFTSFACSLRRFFNANQTEKSEISPKCADFSKIFTIC